MVSQINQLLKKNHKISQKVPLNSLRSKLRMKRSNTSAIISCWQNLPFITVCQSWNAMISMMTKQKTGIIRNKVENMGADDLMTKTDSMRMKSLMTNQKTDTIRSKAESMAAHIRDRWVLGYSPI